MFHVRIFSVTVGILIEVHVTCSDSTANRTLRTAAFTDVNNMTIESCIAFCTPNGYQYAGLEFSRVRTSLAFLVVTMLI